jgi:hypothetical protein
MIPVEQDVHACILRLGDSASDLGVVGVLWLKLNSYTHARHHLSDSRCRSWSLYGSEPERRGAQRPGSLVLQAGGDQ